jgi:membrane protein
MSAARQTKTPATRSGGPPTPIDRARVAAARLSAAVREQHERWRAEHTAYALATEIAREFREHNPGLLARQAAYSLLYAIPSVLLVLVSLAVLVDRHTRFEVSATLQEYVGNRSPGDVQPLLASLLQTAVVETSANAALLAALVSLGIAIWGGANGVGALMYAVNQVYDVRDARSFFAALLTRLGLMLLCGILVIGAFVLHTFGRRLAAWLADGPVDLDPAVTGLLTSGPIWSLGLLFASLLLLYWFALDLPKSLRWLLPGAVVATLAVGIVFALLDLILSVSNPGSAFGAAGGVLVLLWALFVVSQIVVVGAIVNAVLGRRYDRMLIAALAEHPEKRSDRCADTLRPAPASDADAICPP